MVDLGLLQNLFKNAALADQAVNTPEDQFDQVVTFIEQDKINEAAGIIEQVFGKGIPDIRLIVYYFYAHFSHHGIKSFIEIFPGMISIVNEHWEVLCPQNRKDKHVQSSLNWFFSQILIKLKYAEKLYGTGKINSLWKKSVLEVTPDELNHLITIANEFKNFFIEKWPKSSTKERVLHLVKKIEELKPMIEEVKPQNLNESTPEIMEEKPAETPVEYPSSNEEFTDEEIVSPPEYPQLVEQSHAQMEEQTQESQQAAQITALTHTNVNDEIALSLEKLDIFLRKLKVFESLINQNDYLKAAIVSKDIDHLLENFDPINFFPKVFAKYFALFAKHVAALSEQYEKKESLQVKSLEKLYRADLDMFIDW